MCVCVSVALLSFAFCLHNTWYSWINIRHSFFASSHLVLSLGFCSQLHALVLVEVDSLIVILIFAYANPRAQHTKHSKTTILFFDIEMCFIRHKMLTSYYTRKIWHFVMLEKPMASSMKLTKVKYQGKEYTFAWNDG